MPDEDLTVRTRLRAREHCAVSAGDDVGDSAAVRWREEALLVGQQVMQDDMLRRSVAQGIVTDAGSLHVRAPERSALADHRTDFDVRRKLFGQDNILPTG